jgi:monovalent cation/proton antiporter MnhG/PhaG subunit
MLVMLLDVVAVALMMLGSIVTTISVYGVLRMPDVYSQLHASGLASGVGALAILLASIATRDAATITDAALIASFLLLTAPVSGHAIAWAAYRRRTHGPGRSADSGRPTESSR